jgi:hypothetical protein
MGVHFNRIISTKRGKVQIYCIERRVDHWDILAGYGKKANYKKI